MRLDDTAAAIATSTGYAALGTIRISGGLVLSVIQQIFQPAFEITEEFPTRKPVLGHFIDINRNKPIDQVLLTFYKSPSSYTGEDMAEISFHGNPLILDKAMEILNSLGVRTAEPGEFTYRAYLYGKIDLTQAEGINNLAGALTLTEARAALESAMGGLKERISEWKTELIQMFSRLEGEIEFSEETEGTFFNLEDEMSHVEKILGELDDILGNYKYSRLLRKGVDVVITGRANAGKSTLFNRLLKTDRVIVTATPGTTRDVVSESIDLDGLPVRLYDTAGLEEHEGELEKEGVFRARKMSEEADFLIILIDGSKELTGEDLKIIENAGNKPGIIVFNKSDLSGTDNPEKKKLGDVSRETIQISALKDSGIDELKRNIINSIGWNRQEARSGILLQSRRQHELMLRFRHSLQAFLSSLSDDFREEISAIHLRDALKPLDEVTGAVNIEDVYNIIFSSFCIGK
ncbi:MAG: tRNA uridine-5-carboxymethylaminomethyl(34) synthesis GTPase MnmE [Acidobacteria bacterium]|nr:tRNA uridine-5-carboxymethylaminomethyl(34) synthesis GTPase MnmE [Acidobacteriota bacterium]